MATETDPDAAFGTDAERALRRVKGLGFQALLLLATSFGLLGLVALFALLARDGLGLLEASPEWYLLYLLTLVAPMTAYALYVRKRPVAADVNAYAFGVAVGATALSLAIYHVVLALDPLEVVVPLGFAAVPAVVAYGYAAYVRNSHLAGLAGIGVAGVGALAWWQFSTLLLPYVEVATDWVLFYALVTVPAAGILSVVVARRFDRRVGAATGVLLLAAVGAIGLLAPSLGRDPAFLVVLASSVVAPGTVLVADTAVHRRERCPGLLGPVVLVGVILLGAWLERFLPRTWVDQYFAVRGLESWLTPTLLTESWSTFRPEQAGVYPQIVGSIMIVTLMAGMAFPVGIGAAIYLEEYAPESGLGGRIVTFIDVNISNLAGVPSVVYGLLGLWLFREIFEQSSAILLSASATLGLLILPIVIVSAQEALRSVPDEYRQGSYGMGASRWQTIRHVVLPRAVPGILTGTILAMGRAIGETAPLVMIGISATRFSPPVGLFENATALPLQIYAAHANSVPAYREGLVPAAALVLLVMFLLMNATAIVIRHRYQSDSM